MADLAAPAVASSLIAFIIVYFVVFTAGVIYLLRLMAAPPHCRPVAANRVSCRE